MRKIFKFPIIIIIIIIVIALLFGLYIYLQALYNPSYFRDVCGCQHPALIAKIKEDEKEYSVKFLDGISLNSYGPISSVCKEGVYENLLIECLENDVVKIYTYVDYNYNFSAEVDLYCMDCYSKGWENERKKTKLKLYEDNTLFTEDTFELNSNIKYNGDNERKFILVLKRGKFLSSTHTREFTINKISEQNFNLLRQQKLGQGK